MANRDGMSEGKGKGKDVAPESGSSPPVATPGQQSDPPEGTRSLVARIADSGSSLASSFFSSRPGAEDLTQYAAGGSGKAGPAQQQGYATRTLGEASSSGYQPRVEDARSGAVFRPGHVQEHVAQQEAAFSEFLDGADPMELAPGLASDSLQTLDSDNVFDQLRRQGEVMRATAEHAGRDISHQEADDGAAVVDLLSRYEEEPPDYDQDPSLSEKEIEQLRTALFGDAQGGSGKSPALDWDHALNFIPDFVRPDQSGDLNMEKAEETYSALGVTHSPEASRIWVEQWEDVLSRYTDEVWGDLTPLVRTAQKELQELEKPREPEAELPSTKALSRLRQILGHVRARL